MQFLNELRDFFSSFSFSLSVIHVLLHGFGAFLQN